MYVDSDPIVLAHARALLANTDLTTVITGDLRNPDGILDDPRLRGQVDLTQPYALLLVAIAHFLADEDDPYGIVRRLVDGLSSGSYLIFSHLTADDVGDEVGAQAVDKWRKGNSTEVPTLRSHEQIARFFDGLDLLEPGLVPVSRWRPELHAPVQEPFWLYGGVGRKP